MKRRSIQSIYHPSVSVALVASMFTHRSAMIRARVTRAVESGAYNWGNMPVAPRNCPQRIGVAQPGWREAARKRVAKHKNYLRARNVRRAQAA